MTTLEFCAGAVILIAVRCVLVKVWLWMFDRS